MGKITVDLISSKEFTEVSRGYDPKEVDDFLDDICDEIEAMEKQIMDLKQQTTTAARSAEPRQDSGVSAASEQSFREVLELAVQVKEDTIRKAKEDAEAIRAKAETEASERLDGLAEERKSLEKEVGALKAAATEYRAKFEALLQAQQEALEKASDLF